MLEKEHHEETPVEGERPARRSRKTRLLLLAGATALLLAAAVVAVVVILTRPPADRARAQELMRKSDEQLEALRPKGEKINTSVNLMRPDLGYLTSAQYEMTKSNIHAELDESIAQLAEVRKGYQDILGLKDVDEYGQYAKVQLALLDLDLQQLNVVDGYLDYLSKALADRDAGIPLDGKAVADVTSSSVSQLKELGSRVEKLTAEAEKMKKSRTL
jgi:hypothetical protein